MMQGLRIKQNEARLGAELLACGQAFQEYSSTLT